jgi:hypothetical protein
MPSIDARTGERQLVEQLPLVTIGGEVRNRHLDSVADRGAAVLTRGG